MREPRYPLPRVVKFTRQYVKRAPGQHTVSGAEGARGRYDFLGASRAGVWLLVRVENGGEEAAPQRGQNRPTILARLEGGARAQRMRPSTRREDIHVQRSLFRVGFDNDPSAGSPTETLLRLLLPLNDKVQWTSRDVAGSEPPTSPRSEHFTGPFNR